MKIPVKVLLVLVLFATLPDSRSALAQDTEYLCYWQRNDGTTVDLSTLCNNSVRNKTTISPTAAFVANFRALANKYPDQIRQALEAYINQNQDSAIASAKSTCRVLRFGGATAVASRRQKLAASNSSTIIAARQQIIEPLAISHFCPELANR